MDSLGDNAPVIFDGNGPDFGNCNFTEVIKFLQKLAKTPNASKMNLAFTKHITSALIEVFASVCTIFTNEDIKMLNSQESSTAPKYANGKEL